MENLIIVAVIAVIVGVAALHVIKAKKNGQKCIGCPSGCTSKSGKTSACNCGTFDDSDCCCCHTDSK